MFGLDPITIGVGALIWAAFKKQSDTKFGEETPERAIIFKNAMEFAEAARLRELAKMFEKDGLKAQAFWMRKRAAWRSRDAATKAKHDAIFEQAMNSEKIEGILGVAKLFEEETATIKAQALRERAKSLNEARQKKEAEAKAAKAAEVETLKAIDERLKAEAAKTEPTDVMTSHNSKDANGGLHSSPEAAK